MLSLNSPFEKTLERSNCSLIARPNVSSSTGINGSSSSVIFTLMVIVVVSFGEPLSVISILTVCCVAVSKLKALLPFTVNNPLLLSILNNEVSPPLRLNVRVSFSISDAVIVPIVSPSVEFSPIAKV